MEDEALTKAQTFQGANVPDPNAPQMTRMAHKVSDPL